MQSPDLKSKSQVNYIFFNNKIKLLLIDSGWPTSFSA